MGQSPGIPGVAGTSGLEPLAPTCVGVKDYWTVTVTVGLAPVVGPQELLTL
jgi:hypothetical protein